MLIWILIILAVVGVYWTQSLRQVRRRWLERLDLPLRERNQLLVAAGFAPVYPERPLDDAAMAAARSAVSLVLAGHEPYPALAVDRQHAIAHVSHHVAEEHVFQARRLLGWLGHHHVAGGGLSKARASAIRTDLTL